MEASQIPPNFPIAFGADAGADYIRTIPEASQIGDQNGAASLTDGFPPLCFQPIAAGGAWPFGQDMNGILQWITQAVQWQQMGGPVVYNAAFQTAIGGYPNGAIIGSAATPGLLWQSTVDGNTTNPDTGGAGWINLSRGRFLGTQAFPAGGDFVPYAGTNSLLLEGVGAGGAGGGTPALSATTGAAAPGGESGAYGRIFYQGNGAGAVIAVGTGGVGAAGAAGTDGGDTTFTCGGTTITWGGGAGGDLGIASAVPCVQTSAGLASSVLTVSGPNTSLIFSATGGAGEGGLLLSLGGPAAGTVPVVGGIGKDGPWGGAHRGGQLNGNTATGPGASGSGAGAVAYGTGASDSAPAYMGGDGANGMLLISMFT